MDKIIHLWTLHHNFNAYLPPIREHRSFVCVPQLFGTSLVTTETEKQSVRGYFQVLLKSPFPLIKPCVNCPEAYLKIISISVLLSLRLEKSNIKLSMTVNEM